MYALAGCVAARPIAPLVFFVGSPSPARFVFFFPFDWMTGWQGKEFVYRGYELEQMTEFQGRIKAKFPNAELLGNKEVSEVCRLLVCRCGCRFFRETCSGTPPPRSLVPFGSSG